MRAVNKTLTRIEELANNLDINKATALHQIEEQVKLVVFSKTVTKRSSVLYFSRNYGSRKLLR